MMECGAILGSAQASFDADYDQDGVENGAEYTVPAGMAATVSGGVSEVFAVIREDPAVTTTLWVSQDLVDWSSVGLSVSPDQSGVAPGFSRMTAPGENGKFYRIRFSR